MNAWIGSGYEQAGRILILGESWYGDDEPLTDYVPRWARGEQEDRLFSRLYNALSGRRREKSTEAQRLACWQSFAFYNFVPGSVGPTNEHRPKAAQFRAARAPLASTLVTLAPTGVWILGLQQAEHSLNVVEAFGAIHEVVMHRGSANALKQSWELLRSKVSAST